MIFFSASAPEQQPQPRPYQGVRVKEPVKELLKRKRGNVHNSSAAAATTVGKNPKHSRKILPQELSDCPAPAGKETFTSLEHFEGPAGWSYLAMPLISI